jgi:arylsulfatase A-like enzyme
VSGHHAAHGRILSLYNGIMNVLVLSIPGLRPHYLGCYGNEWVATPALDQFTTQGVVFDRHYADCPGTAAELRPEWTGRAVHHVLRPVTAAASASLAQVREVLAAHEVAHAFPEGFRRPCEEKDPLGEELLSQLLTWVKNRARGDRWCAWAELRALNPPWQLPAEQLTVYFDEEEEGVPWAGDTDGPRVLDNEEYVCLQQTYAAVVTHLDGVLESFLDALQQLPAFEETLLVLTADQGVALGEHGVVGPSRPWLHDELVHLPLIVRLPRAAQAGRRVAALTQSVDLYATVLHALGLTIPDGESSSLLPLALGQKQSGREFVVTSARVGEAVEWALRTRDWAYLLPAQAAANDPPRTPQLYAKPEDAWEVNNVRERHQELAEQLEQQLRSHIEGVARGERNEHRSVGG